MNVGIHSLNVLFRASTSISRNFILMQVHRSFSLPQDELPSSTYSNHHKYRELKNRKLKCRIATEQSAAAPLRLSI